MNWIEICTSQTQGTCPSSLLFQTMCGDRARSVHCNSYIPLALKICLRILVKVRKVTTEVLKGECLGHFILIETVSFLSQFIIFRKKNCFIIFILKSLLILAIWLALRTMMYFWITLSFALSGFFQALSIWQNMKWTAPKKTSNYDSLAHLIPELYFTYLLRWDVISTGNMTSQKNQRSVLKITCGYHNHGIKKSLQ